MARMPVWASLSVDPIRAHWLFVLIGKNALCGAICTLAPAGDASPTLLYTSGALLLLSAVLVAGGWSIAGGAAGGLGSGSSGGGGGSASGGSGGNGRTGTAGAGAAGSAAGGGGAGAMGTAASHSFAGGNGAAGRVELEYTPSYVPAGGGIRAVADEAVDITSAPAVADNLALSPGDVLLLVGNGNYVDPTTLAVVSDNGLYTWSSAGSAMTTLTTDTDGSFRDVREGTHAGARVFVSSSAFSVPPTRPLGNVYFIDPSSRNSIIGGRSGPEGFVGVSPAVTSGGTWTVQHNLGTKFLLVQVAATATPFAYVTTWAIQRTDLNTLSVIVGSTIAAGDYEVMVRAIL